MSSSKGVRGRLCVWACMPVGYVCAQDLCLHMCVVYSCFHAKQSLGKKGILLVFSLQQIAPL